MEWKGKNVSTHLLVEKSCEVPEYLAYVFHHEGVASAPTATQPTIQHAESHSDLMTTLNAFRNEYPLFVLFEAGRLPENGRPW